MALTNEVSTGARFARPAAERVAPPMDRRYPARTAFAFLLLFTFLLYGRPGDIILAIRTMPLAQGAAVLALIAYIVSKVRGEPPLVLTPEVKIVAALTVLFIAGVPFAIWKGGAFQVLTKEWFKTALIFFLLAQVAGTLARVRALLWVIVICMFATSVLSLFGLSYVMETGGRMIGVQVGMLSGNYLGITVATILPYLAVMLVLTRNAVKSLFLLATFGLVMMMVIMTASRASLIIIVAALVLMWILVLRRSAKARIMGVMFVVALSVALAFAPETFWARVVTIWDEDSYASSWQSASAVQSEMQRKALLDRSIEATLSHPIFGVGVGNFAVYSGTSTGNAQEWKGTHNTYTQVSSEAGIPALLLFIALMVVSIRNMRVIVKQCGEREEVQDLRYFAYATQVAVVAFMFASFFAHMAYDYALYYITGLGVALQIVAARSFGKPGTTNAAAAATAGRRRLPDGNDRGRAW